MRLTRDVVKKDERAGYNGFSRQAGPARELRGRNGLVTEHDRNVSNYLEKGRSSQASTENKFGSYQEVLD